MKSVLVIDTPTHCGECPVKCQMRGINHVPTWCPLKPLPHKLQADWYTDGYKEGFNACLDEILGETE